MKKIFDWYKTHTMYKLIGTGVAVLILFGLWTWADVYVFEDGSVFTTLPTAAVAVQRIEAVGEDFRAYEFKLKSAPWTCVFAAGDVKGGLFCFPTPPETPGG